MSTVAAYGLRQPSVVDARASIERIYGSIEADAIWNELTGPALGAARRAVTLEEIVEAMLTSRHDVVRLCGQALQIRVRSYTPPVGGADDRLLTAPGRSHDRPSASPTSARAEVGFAFE